MIGEQPRSSGQAVSSSQWLSIAGLALTLAGAAILAWRDLRRVSARRATGGKSTMFDLEYGFRRPEAWIGFPLIAVGSVLQIIGVAVS
jgi:hypothetical protein